MDVDATEAQVESKNGLLRVTLPEMARPKAHAIEIEVGAGSTTPAARRDRMKAEELMTRDVRTCGPEDRLSVAARIMWDRDCGCVPVVEQANGAARVVGMLTDRDVCMAAYTQGRSLEDITVRSAMAPDVRSCRCTDTLDTAVKTLEENQIRRLPVLDEDGRLAGMLSLADIAREAEREHGRGQRDVSDDQVAEALEAISRPRQYGAQATPA